jgi:hypothetical protein
VSDITERENLLGSCSIHAMESDGVFYKQEKWIPVRTNTFTRKLINTTDILPVDGNIFLASLKIIALKNEHHFL